MTALPLLAIDPGDDQSAWVLWDGANILGHNTWPNAELLGEIRGGRFDMAHVLVIEMIASYGMPVGRSVFETCVWVGRFIEAWYRTGLAWRYAYRRQIKLDLCGHAGAKDSHVREALIDRFGGKATAIGKKKIPGPLYGIVKDEWAALAVAVTASSSTSAYKETA
jgi:hypothetical protein